MRTENINAFVIELYRKHSELYQKDEVERRRYFARHPTFFSCLKCMDGRVEFPSMTKTARGLVTPYRAIGGRFETWWPAFQDAIIASVKMAVTKDAYSCFIVTDHFCSREQEFGRYDLGCKGWHNDHTAAREHMERISQEFRDDYGGQVIAIPTSVDTSKDSMIMHGPDGKTLVVATLIDQPVDIIRQETRRVFPDMPAQVIKDLVPFLYGNAQRTAELSRNPRKLSELEHDERVIAIGEGFDGLAAENFALMNSDINPNLDEAIVVAAQLIEEKLIGAAPSEQTTIFTNRFFGNSRHAFHTLPSMDKKCAIRRSRGLQQFAQKHIREKCPALWGSGRLHFLTAITRDTTRELEVIEQGQIT